MSMSIEYGPGSVLSGHNNTPLMGDGAVSAASTVTRPSSDSDESKRTLADLERELLGDDNNNDDDDGDDFSSPVSGSDGVGSGSGTWTGVLHNLLSAAADFPIHFPSSPENEERDSKTSDDNNNNNNKNKNNDDDDDQTRTRPRTQPQPRPRTSIQTQTRTRTRTRTQAQSQACSLPAASSSCERGGEGESGLKESLLACAAAVEENDFSLASLLIDKLGQIVSPDGDPLQRLGACMVDGLAARICSPPPSPSPKEAVAVSSRSSMKYPPNTQLMYQVCPYYKFGYLAANGAIAEAFKNEDKVHIIDFGIGQGCQWPPLISAFASRSGGCPDVRITAVRDPQSNDNSPEELNAVGQKLRDLADSLEVRFEFYLLAMDPAELKSWIFTRKPGEALAVNFAFQLHRMPDESVSTTNPRDTLLRMVKSMAPKVVTLVEHEANTNTAPFFHRFSELLAYYTAVFESLDAALPRHSQARLDVERTHLSRNIVNIVSQEGAERIERYELAGKWKARMQMAGFQPYPLSAHINNTIRSLLKNYSENYRLREEHGSLYLGWLERPLIVASAWQ